MQVHHKALHDHLPHLDLGHFHPDLLQPHSFRDYALYVSEETAKTNLMIEVRGR